jgi:hypothetical protein
VDDREIDVGFVRTPFDTSTGPDTATLADETTTGVRSLPRARNHTSLYRTGSER